MKAISIEIDNEYFMVKVERTWGRSEISKALISIVPPDQSAVLYIEDYQFSSEKHCEQFELDFDKRDARKIAKRYMKCR